MPKIKPVEISNFARSTLGWPARILFSAGLCRLPPAWLAARRAVRLLAEA